MSFRETKNPRCEFSPKTGKDYIICPHPEIKHTTQFCQVCADMHIAGRLNKIHKDLERLNDGIKELINRQ